MEKKLTHSAIFRINLISSARGLEFKSWTTKSDTDCNGLPLLQHHTIVAVFPWRFVAEIGAVNWFIGTLPINTKQCFIY